jgi:3-deoxy-7-phosphoheptulonate synthase
VCIKKTYNQLKEEGLLAKIMVDFSHANSQKKFKNQLLVGDEIAKQISTGSDKIFGVMIESHLNEGNQAIGPLESLKYGVSITDSCIGWDDTENLLKTLAQAVQKRNA